MGRCNLIGRLTCIACLATVLCCTSLASASAQYSPEQKAIYDVGFEAGRKRGYEEGYKVGSTTASSTTTVCSSVPVFSGTGGSTTYQAPYYFLVQKPSGGLGAIEFKKDAAAGTTTIKDVETDTLAKLFAEGKLAPVKQTDHNAALKDFLGMYEQQLKNLGAKSAPAPIGAAKQ
jgi:hypothetical protein